MALSLSKQQEKVKLSLKKVTRKEVRPIQVKLLADVSYSMKNHYKKDGYMLPILQRSIALASIVDPDKVVQIIAFSSDAVNLGDFGVDKFDDIWNVFSKENSDFWYGTDYSRGIKEVSDDLGSNGNNESFGFLSKIFGSKKSSSNEQDVNLVIFITDGEDGGSESRFKSEVNKLLSGGNTYLMLIGSEGNIRYYETLKRMADQHDNIGFKYFESAKNLTDDMFYDTILSGEFGRWLDERPLKS